MNAQITLRLEQGQAKKLEEVAERSYMTPSSLIRYAVDMLIETAEKNNGSILALVPPGRDAKAKKAA